MNDERREAEVMDTSIPAVMLPDCLLLNGVDSGPTGSYSPTGFVLLGSGADRATDRFAHLHEAHHAALNDSTAWGTALHVVARLPGASAVFSSMLDGCRRVHESFATLAPLVMLAEQHPELEDLVRERYPEYWRLREAAGPLVDVGAGPNRRYLLATQVARVCMQTPVLQALHTAVLERGSGPLRLTPPRARDTPDGRWAMLLRAGAEVAAAAVEAADRACAALPGGPEVLALDESGVQTDEADGRDALDPSHDPIWALWEGACYESLTSWLVSRGAVVLSLDGHQEPTRALVQAVAAIDPRIGLGAAVTNGSARDDQQVAEAVLEQARHVYWVAGASFARSRVASVGVIAELVSEPARVEGGAVLVLDARPVGRLAQMYEWLDGGPNRPPGGGSGVVVAVRRVRETEGRGDGSGEGLEGTCVSVIEHNVLASPEDALAVLDSWDHPATPIACVSASSLVDAEWMSAWWSLLTGRCTAFVLLDVEPGRVAPGWVRAQARRGDDGPALSMGRVEVTDSGVLRHVVALQPEAIDSGLPVWLSFHDDLGASVLMQALRTTPGLRVESTTAHLGPLGRELQVAITHLLATEPYFDLGGLNGWRG